MYVLGYSLDNLSLMALTIAVGFVVDDAIVMLENIFRHIEDGMKPMEAALKGAGEIGFTIVSISFSLVAVFIPLLLMGGIVGRLFREFADHRHHRRAGLRLRLPDADADDVLALPAPRHSAARMALYRAIEAMLRRHGGFYRRTLDVALRHQFITLMVFLGTVDLTVYLYIDIPKGFFPTAGQRHRHRHHRGGAGHLLRGDGERAAAPGRDHAHDPDTGASSSSIGGGVGGQRRITGRLFITPETVGPAGRRGAAGNQPAATQDRQGAGRQAVPAADQDVRVGGRLAKTEFQYTLQDADLDELYTWAPKILDKLRRCRCCATLPATSRIAAPPPR